MTLSEFINNKPSELRLGQHFYNCYLSRLTPADQMHKDTQVLYFSRDNIRVVGIIHKIMQDYQWKELP